MCAASFKRRRIVEPKIARIAAVLFRGSPFAVKARILRRFLGWRRRKILVKRLGLGRWPPPVATGQNFYDPDLIALGKGQHVARPHRFGWFGLVRAIQPQMPRTHNRGGNGPGFKKPGLPKPFVDANFGPDQIGHFALNAAKAAANGLSMSIALSRP